MSTVAGRAASRSMYPERAEPKENALDGWARAAVGGWWQRLTPSLSRLRRLAEAAGASAAAVADLSDDALRQRMRAVARGAMDNAVDAAQAFALVREACRRSLGKTPYDVQLMGAATLFAGRLAEMQTGEGKTLTAALAACIAGVARLPTHVVTVNDYLALRDAAEMLPLYAFFGLDVGTIVTGMSLDARRSAYACSVTYCTNKELVFDYLKDRVSAGGMVSRAQLMVRSHVDGRAGSGLLLRGLHFAIVDEADSILIDEARTPLILAAGGAATESPEIYAQSLMLAQQLAPVEHYELRPDRRELHLTAAGRARVAEDSSGMGEAWTAGHAREHLVAQALRALHLFQRDQHYVVADEKVHIVDEYTGRILAGRKWEQGLHQLIETKEGCELSDQTVTLARITYQRFFRRYLRLSGMTGTAREVEREIRAVYALATQTIPTNRPGMRVTFAPECCSDEAAKWARVTEEARRMHGQGRPVLIGSRSVEASERLSAALHAGGLAHRVINARQDADEAAIIAQAGQAGMITVATNMAGRGTDIHLGDGVVEAGGLHVILTEYHDSSRIDRQLFGRCARQGDAGSAQAIVACDDALFVDHGGRLYVRLMRLFPRGLPPPMIGMLRAYVQRRAQRMHARTRRDTLKQDRKLDAMLSFAGNQV